jgi:hypothetical protein
VEKRGDDGGQQRERLGGSGEEAVKVERSWSREPRSPGLSWKESAEKNQTASSGGSR